MSNLVAVKSGKIKNRKYHTIQDYIRKRIQTGKYPVGSYLPSENEICGQFSTTRTTVRKALDELLKEGFIEKEQGKGSKVLERRKSLGLLTVKGFSGATDHEVKTVVTDGPKVTDWDPIIAFALTEEEKKSNCVYFQRVRYINDRPVVLENNWYANNELPLIDSDAFIAGSFFKTLSQKHLIEVMGAEQELKSIPASKEVAKNLEIQEGSPILHISVRFRTSKPGLNLYGDLYCNTTDYPIRNSYFL
ncbi:GntR family transcriptional regulator [uncultured Kriegella sp.]|uniref:GntR family transcriptional regulator n=1 Tax=uncultured Kriegella sp. TaxID=1798910 RepID=UPI0030D8FBC7|tara:strand:+ start:9239 stop:9979 length:741 start_codon:yes stop_codon:yes gene_type:complete